MVSCPPHITEAKEKSSLLCSGVHQKYTFLPIFLNSSLHVMIFWTQDVYSAYSKSCAPIFLSSNIVTLHSTSFCCFSSRYIIDQHRQRISVENNNQDEIIRWQEHIFNLVTRRLVQQSPRAAIVCRAWEMPNLKTIFYSLW